MPVRDNVSRLDFSNGAQISLTIGIHTPNTRHIMSKYKNVTVLHVGYLSNLLSYIICVIAGKSIFSTHPDNDIAYSCITKTRERICGGESHC